MMSLGASTEEVGALNEGLNGVVTVATRRNVSPWCDSFATVDTSSSHLGF